MALSRRNFIKVSAAAAAGSAIAADAKKSVKVYVGSGSDIYSITKKTIEAAGGLKQFIKNKARVVLKPNIGFPNPPNWSTTTHPDIVKAVAEMCVEAGARKVIIVDNPLRDAEVCQKNSGIKDAVKGIKEAVIYMPEQKKNYKEVEVPGAKDLKTTAAMKEVLKADVLINIPTGKSHSAADVSFCLKNLMGLIYDRKIFHRGLPDMNRAIAELGLLFKPALNIVDMKYALLTRGPAGPGKVEELNKVVISTDIVAADSYSTGLAKWDGKKQTGLDIGHIKIAGEIGVGEINLEKMEIINVT